MKSILQDWVMELGLRHQGALVSIIRGCDGVPKNDPSKGLIRALRYELLVPHCGDAAKAASFIEKVTRTELLGRMQAVAKNFDHYPVHFLLHLLHAAEIIGYKHACGRPWLLFYAHLCGKMHVNVETEDQMDARLNATEEEFGKAATAEDIAAAFRSDAYKGKSTLIARMPGPPQRDAKEQLVDIETGMRFMSGEFFRNPNQADPTRPMSEQLPEGLVKGFFDHKSFHVTLASNHYSQRTEQADFQMWEIGWHCADLAKDNGYNDPRPRQEGYDAYYRGVNVMSNPYQGIAKGSQEWTTGWKRAEENDKFQQAKAEGHICDGNRGHCQQDCPRNKANRNAGKVGPGFDGSGFYDGHKPSTKELDDQAALQYRGVPRS